MTGAAGHLVSHSGYGSLIVPGVLLKRQHKTPASPERKSFSGSAEGSKEPDRGQRTPRRRGPISPAPPPSTPLSPQRGDPGRTFTCQLHHPLRPAGRPSESQHSSRAGCRRKNPKGIPSQRKLAKRLFLQAEGHRARRVPRDDTPPLSLTYQIIHVQKRLSYPEIRHPAA